MYDTIIIGAGMSGLAAGIRLAHFGRRVCIVERHATVGGLNSFYRLRGRAYDVGLHAVTNYAPKGAKQGPLPKLLRQLRISWDELALVPQCGSTVAFPGVSLRFSNDLDLLRAEIGREFPSEKDNFERLLGQIADYEQLGQPGSERSARDVMAEVIADRLLVEMLLCPILFYGGCRERDIEFGQFSVLFRSVFLEGLARPAAGVRQILRTLVRHYKERGGELRLRSGVDRIVIRNGAAAGVILDGEELPAAHVLSSAGWHETMRLCGQQPAELPPAGRLSFVETISVLAAEPRLLGLDQAAVFFNDSPMFDYARPHDLIDLRSGVVCSPNNFQYLEPLPAATVRITALANCDRWAALDADAYRVAKAEWYARMAASAVRFVPDFRSAVIETDVFTPTTIRRFTGHENGAVYGAPEKRYDGTTCVKNLLLCGTDQGLVGIVGAIVSGITVANRHLLAE